MVYVDLDFEGLVAPWTLFGSHLTGFLMATKTVLWCFMGTILALDKCVELFFMLLSFTLGDDFTALLALVVLSHAANLVHAELTHLDGSLAVRANLGLLLGLNHFCHLIF